MTYHDIFIISLKIIMNIKCLYIQNNENKIFNKY